MLHNNQSVKHFILQKQDTLDLDYTVSLLSKKHPFAVTLGDVHKAASR